MNKKELREKIIKLLNDDYVEDKIGEASPNISADAVGSIAEDIVNLLPIHDVSVSFSERIQNLIDYRGKKVDECIELNDIEEAARQRIKQKQLVEILYILNER